MDTSDASRTRTAASPGRSSTSSTTCAAPSAEIRREPGKDGDGRTAATRGLHGRRKGRRLRPRRRRLLEELYPRLAVDPRAPAPAELTALFDMPVRDVWLEIGFGGGEHLVHQARRHPDVGLIGCEPFETGMARMLAAIEAGALSTIRLYRGDGRDLLDWLPPASLGRVFLLYPDPWPKKRHFKRRFVSAETVAGLARVLRPGGTLRFASDIESYVEWTREHLAESPAFRAEPRDPAAPWRDWPGTRYEAKALAEGRTPAYLTFRRV